MLIAKGTSETRINYAKVSLIRDTCASVLNAVIPNLLSEPVIYRLWVM